MRVNAIEICRCENYMSYSLLRTYIVILIAGVNARREQAVIWDT